MATHLLRQRRARLSGVILTILVLALLALTYGLFVSAIPRAAEPPPGYQLAREIDLASQAFAAENMLAFTLDDTSTVGIFYALEDVDTDYFELSLLEADGTSTSLIKSEGLRTDAQGSGQWEGELPAGSYDLLLSASQGQGKLKVYWDRP